MSLQIEQLLPSWFLQSRLKLRHLQILSAFSKLGTLHEAASMLMIPQPMASKLLGELEDALGVQLFDREGRRLVLNLYGQTFVRRAENILGELEGIKEEFNALIGGYSGRVSIGSIDGPIVSLIPKAVIELRKAYPAVDIDVLSGTSAELFDDLFAGTIDIMIGHTIQNIDHCRFSYERIRSENLEITGRADHPLAQQEKVTLYDTIEYPWILQDKNTISRRKIDLLFETLGGPYPYNLINSSSLTMTLTYLNQTDALTALPEAIARAQASYGQVSIIPVDVDLTITDYGLILPTDRRASPSVQIATGIIRRLVKTDDNYCQRKK